MTDQAAITEVMRQFFSAFESGPDAATRIDALRTILLPEAVIVNANAAPPVIHTVESFIAPRVALLGNGSLTHFKEWMVGARIDVFGDVAHVWCTYEKSWVREGVRWHGKGTKTVQFVRTVHGWRISSVAWDDEPSEGVPTAENVGPRS